MWIMLEKTHIRLMKEADEKSSAKMINLENEREKMKSDLEKLNFKNNQNLKDLKNLQSSYDELNLKHTLISEILSSKLENSGIRKFDEILNNDYRDFAKKEDTLASEAEQLIILQSIKDELIMIASCKELFDKTLLPVGGGFSAGKSEFINSFMSGGVKLARSIEPTTAIPMYIIDGKSGILGYNKTGGVTNFEKSINLKNSQGKIENFIAKLTHDFISKLGFNLKQILPFMVLTTAMKYKNICFVDTPGYNPAKVGAQSDDKQSAKEFLAQSNKFIWLVSAESGTITNDDLNFLNELNLDNKELYIVVNKSDLKSDSDIQNIIEKISGILDDNMIDFVGISAYSSLNKITGYYEKKSLDEFLGECDKKSNKLNEIVDKIYGVYKEYRCAMETSLDNKKEILDELKSIGLDFIEQSGDFDNKATKNLQEFSKWDYFKSELEKQNLKNLEKVINGFIEAIGEVFGEKIIVNFDERYKNDNVKTPKKKKSVKKAVSDKKEVETNEVGKGLNGVVSLLLGSAFLGMGR
ncbi:dynamin family protein [Campylobacter sp. JMF_08 NE1]|uniref:dynamin family protein n=1 Tax=Campylobacter sp. JMF_08 NE1 TaxID=2983821 RepID=UPI0022E9B8C3|nr:dynamin family protein [Campylobacter sp. JMF_08 NE1]MDA3048136.1 dynamin family protein [Campylobacter sp. JMF_08 NE1]